MTISGQCPVAHIFILSGKVSVWFIELKTSLPSSGSSNRFAFERRSSSLAIHIPRPIANLLTGIEMQFIAILVFRTGHRDLYSLKTLVESCAIVLEGKMDSLVFRILFRTPGRGVARKQAFRQGQSW